MRILSRIVAFGLMGLLLSLPALGADDKNKKSDAKKEDAAKKTDVKKDDKAKKDDTKKTDDKKDAEKNKDTAPAEKWVRAGTVHGKIIWLDGEKKKLKIQVQVSKDQNVEYELQAMEDVKVRTTLPRAVFDDKGRARRPTAKELKEFKGSDPKLPGYQAEFSDLKTDKTADIVLMKKMPPRNASKKSKQSEEYAPKMSLILIHTQPSS